jgi:hypothetical protein
MQQTFENVHEVMTGAYKENNFCTVVSLAVAFNWSAGKAHRHMAKYGRKYRRGPEWDQYTKALLDAAESEGKTVVFSRDWNGVTLNKFVKAHPKGTWFICVKGHITVLIDGKLHDWTEDTAGKRKIAYRSAFEMNGKYDYGIAKIEG